MISIFKRKMSTEDYAENLYDLTRNLTLSLVKDKETLINLGFAEANQNLVELHCFQYIMYRTNLILWTKLDDELLYGDVSKQYYSLCTEFITQYIYYNSQELNNNYSTGKKLFAEFDNILKDNYHERIRVINAQMICLYQFIRGNNPTLEERIYSLSLALEIENQLLELINSLEEEL